MRPFHDLAPQTEEEEEMRGIFCIDPGESTGIAWGIVDEKTRGQMALQAVKERLSSGSVTISGPEAKQIRELYRLWVIFKRKCVKQFMEPDWVDLVIEDFVLFPGEKPGKRTTVAERISWGLEGYRMAMYDRHRAQYSDPSQVKHYTPIVWQKSGAAHRFAQRPILEEADAWIRGKEHERSAFAHMILRTNVLLDRRLP